MQRPHPLARCTPRFLLAALAGLLLSQPGCGTTPTTDPTPEPPPTPTPAGDTYWDPLSTGDSAPAFTALTGVRASEAWLGTRDGEVYAWTEGTLSLLASLKTPTGEVPELYSLFVLTDERGRLLYAAGTQGAIFTYDFGDGGFEWQTTGTLSTFHELRAFSREDVWAVGEGGVYHQDGTGWKRDTSFPGSAQLDALWGQSSSHLFVAGDAGALFERLEGTWSRVNLGLGEHLYALWGSASDDVWLAGQTGLILHYDGQSWLESESGSFEHLWALFGLSPTQLFAAGTNGATLYYDGIGWQRLPSGTSATLYGLWGTSQTEVYAAGAQGAFLRFDNDPTPPPLETTP